jgi:hypothetical protein
LTGITAWALETQLSSESNPTWKKAIGFSKVKPFEVPKLEKWMLDATPWVDGNKDEVALIEPWMISSIPWVTDTTTVSITIDLEIEPWMLVFHVN